MIILTITEKYNPKSCDQSNQVRKKKRIQEKTILIFAYVIIYIGESIDKLLKILIQEVNQLTDTRSTYKY